MMTYGEAYTHVKLSLKMKNGRFTADRLPYHKQKMKKHEASIYYTNKIRSYFGLPTKVKTKEMINKEYFSKYDISMFVFDSIEDEFDFYEAHKVKRKLQIV